MEVCACASGVACRAANQQYSDVIAIYNHKDKYKKSLRDKDVLLSSRLDPYIIPAIPCYAQQAMANELEQVNKAKSEAGNTHDGDGGNSSEKRQYMNQAVVPALTRQQIQALAGVNPAASGVKQQH